MKKFRVVLMGLMIAAVAMPIFAAKGPKAKMAVNRPVIIDYQGATLGKEIPKWVEVLVEGDNAAVEKALKLEGQKTFIVEARGSNLTFLKSWTDLVDIEREVAGQIERQVAQSVQSTMEGTANGSEAEIKQTIDMYTASLTNVTYNGLERKASFWIQTQTVKPGLKKAKGPDDLIIEYTYYVVYCCPMDMFTEQIEAAIADVETNTDQTGLLKTALTQKLTESLSLGEATTAN